MKKAIKKYKENLDTIRFPVEKGTKERYRKKAAEKGYTSLAKYITDLLERA